MSMLVNEHVSLFEGNIASLEVDVIVNAANSKLLKGSGVCEAVFAGAGWLLEQQCAAKAPCEVGHVVMTDGFDLPAKHIFHAVGPCLTGSALPDLKEEDQLTECYVQSLKLAADSGLRTIAFPALSTGRYKYPKD